MKQFSKVEEIGQVEFEFLPLFDTKDRFEEGQIVKDG